MATDRLINQSQGDDIIDALDDIATSLGNISYGEQTSSDKVVAMTGYEKASTAEAISQADTLNEAVGKLEKKVDDNAADITDKVDGPESATVGNIAIFDNINGKSIDDSGISIETSLDNTKDTEVPTSKAVDTYITGKGYATGVSSSTANNLAAFNTTDGKALKDSGVGIVTSTDGIGDSDTALPTSKAVKNYVDATISGTGRYLGTATAVTDLSTTAKEGDYYVVSTAWTGVHVCDVIIAKKDNPSQSIDDTNWSLLHNESNTDANVEQSPVSTNAEYEVLFSHSANNTLETSGVGKDDGITYNPSTNNLTLAGTMSAGGFTGTGVDTATSGSSASGSDTKVPSTKKLNEELGSVVKSVKLTSSDANPITPTNNTVTIPAFAGSGTGHKAGLVPDPGSTSGTTRYLREDGDWAEPSSSSSSGSNSLSDLDTTKTTNKPNRWTTVYFDGFSFSADHVWSDGTNTYYSSGTYQKILDKTNQVWTDKTWTGLTDYQGKYVWTDGTDIFYSAGTSHYVLNISTSTWSSKSWSGLTDFDGNNIWTDGTTTYYSDGSTQYYLDKSSSNIWRSTSWNIYVASPDYIWSDGNNIYYSNGSDQYILNKSTGEWDEKVWTGLTSFSGASIWTDGEDIYHSSSTQNVLDIANSKWYVKQWLGSYQPSGIYVWSDGLNTYHSNGNTKYVLVKPVKSTKVPSSQLPSYVDDVLEYSSKSSFPSSGESGKIYVDTTTNKTYRWGGSAYVEISESIALGETENTAYYGNKGKTAYEHATDSSRVTSATASRLYKVAATAQGHIASLSAVTKTDITNLGIPGTDTNTHRPIQVNGTQRLGNNTTALNLSAGGNIGIRLFDNTPGRVHFHNDSWVSCTNELHVYLNDLTWTQSGGGMYYSSNYTPDLGEYVVRYFFGATICDFNFMSPVFIMPCVGFSSPTIWFMSETGTFPTNAEIILRVIYRLYYEDNM